MKEKMEKISTIKERIFQFIEYQNIKKSDFFNKTGLSYDNFKGRSLFSELGSEKLVKIITTYPEISTDWLLTGIGNMIRNTSRNDCFVSESDPTYAIQVKNNEGIPLIPVNAIAGFGQGDMPVLDFECDRYIVPIFKDAEFLIQVKGSSMYPKYNSGDIVACKKLLLDGLFFQWNKVYVLDTTQGALIKRVRKCETPEHICIVSDNPNYDTFELHISQIRSVSLVIGVIRLE